MYTQYNIQRVKRYSKVSPDLSSHPVFPGSCVSFPRYAVYILLWILMIFFTRKGVLFHTKGIVSAVLPLLST